MTHAVLPIYHLAMLRGFLLAHNAHAEILTSLDGLYSAAVHGTAVKNIQERTEPDAPARAADHIPDVKKMVQSPIAPSIDHIADMGKMVSELAEPDPALDLPEESWRDRDANKPALNVQLSLEEAKHQFPHFTAMIEEGTADNVADREQNIPDRVEKGIIAPTMDEILPIGDISSNRARSWTGAQERILFDEREKTPPTKWEVIAPVVGKTSKACEVRYSIMKKAGMIDDLRAARGMTLPASEPYGAPPPMKRLPELPLIALAGDTAMSRNQELDQFLRFWEIFPRQRRGGQDNALKAWRQAMKRTQSCDIMYGLHQYIKSQEVARGFAKGAAAWLNDDRWTVDYAAKDAHPYTPASVETLQEKHDETVGARPVGEGLYDADWPDIQALLRKPVGRRQIAADYGVTVTELNTFCDMHLIRDAREKDQKKGVFAQ